MTPDVRAVALVLAVALAVGATLLAVPARPSVAPVGTHRVRRLGASGRRRVLLALVGASVTLVVSGLPGARVVVAGVAAAAAVGAVHLVTAARRSRLAAVRRQQVVDFCESVVGELQAGQPPVVALERSASGWPETGPVAAAAALGADVPTALRRVAELPGAEQLVRLAAAWQIAHTTGSGLAFATSRVLETARAEQATSRRIESELASARATARLVSVLPVVVLVAAQGIGARPWTFLFSTTPGSLCLAGGVALSGLGLAWIDRIAAGALRGPVPARRPRSAAR